MGERVKTKLAQPHPATLTTTSQYVTHKNTQGGISYTMLVMHILPICHALAVAKQNTQICCILMYIKKHDDEDPEIHLSECKYIANAMLTLDLLRTDGHTPPADMHFPHSQMPM